MKSLHSTLLSIAIIFTSIAYSQNNTGGPDQFGYTYRNHLAAAGPTYQWFDISTIGTVVTGLSDDNFVGPFSIGGFPYYSSTPTALYIGSNGYISFSPVNISSSAASFPIIPTLGGPNNFIAPFLTDLTFGGASSNPGLCYFYNQGDTICITWEAVPFWVNNANQYAGDNTFQVILNKADSSITFNYKKQVGAPDPVYINNFLSIGIEDAAGSTGLQYFRGSTFPTPNTSVKFYYPTIVAPITDVSLAWIENDKNGGFFKAQGQNYLPTMNIKNQGNQNVNTSFYVGYRLLDPNGILFDSSSMIISQIGAGVDTTVTFPTSIPLNNPDRYQLKAYISTITGDQVISNDTQAIRLIVVDTSLTTNFLDYTDGTGSPFSISWTGGNGGIATYYEPPYYPARVLSTNFYITNLGNPAVGFHSILYDDNGRQGTHGTVLDSAFIPSGSIITGNYYSHPLFTSNIIIPNGGVYLFWLMDGDGISLGRTIENPSSNQTYEVLFGSWAPYRSADTEDFSMGIQIVPITTGLNDGESSLKTFKVYPNPANEYVVVESLVEAGQLQANDYQLMDIQGRSIEAKLIRNGDEYRLYRGNLSPGVYVLRIGKSIAKIQFAD